MPQLAEKIRAKYPGEYDDLDDHTLEKLVLSKYPEYKDLVVPESNTALPRTSDNTDIAPSNTESDPNQFVGPKQSTSKDYSFGNRWDESTKSYSGSPKGLGYLGPLKNKNGDVMSEFSRDGEINGNNVQYPLMVPTLTKDEINQILTTEKTSPSIEQKARDFAIQRIKQGKNPFAEEGEQSNIYPELERATIKSQQQPQLQQSLDKWGVGPANYGPNTESFLSHEFLPEMKQPETWMGGFTKGLYDEFVRPLSSPRNILSGLITGGTGSKIASELGGSEIGAAPSFNKGALSNIAQDSINPELKFTSAPPTSEGPINFATKQEADLAKPAPIVDESGRELAPPESNNIQPRPEGPWDTMNVSQPNPQSEGLDDLFNRANKKLASGQPSFEQQFGSDYGSGYGGNGKLQDVAASTINPESAAKSPIEQMTQEGQFSGDRTTGNFEPIDQAGNPIGLDSISPEEWDKIGINNDSLSKIKNPEWDAKTLNDLRNEVRMSNIDISKFKNADDIQEHIDTRNAMMPGAKTISDYNREAQQEIFKNKIIDVGNKEEPNPWMGESGNDRSPLKRLISGEEGAVRIKSDDSVLGKLNVGQTVLVKPEKMTPAIYKRMKEQGFEHIGMNDEGAFRWKKVSESGASQPILESEIGNTRARQRLGPAVDAKQASLAKELVNFPRTVLASNDLSAPLRQGLGLIHKKQFWNALPDMIKAFKSEDFYNQAQQDILDRPLFKKRMGIDGKEINSFAEDAGLKLTDLVDISSREESRQSSLAEKLYPGVRMSDRGYTLFLNKLRADTFESLINQAKIFGVDGTQNLPLAHDLANFVNNATGRGSLKFGKLNLEQSATNLATVLFSPRLIASRLQMMNPANYVMGNPMVRKEYLKSLFAIAALGNTITGLSKVANYFNPSLGTKVEYDPASADFGKLRIGNTRVDPYGGWQQYIVAAQRLIPNLKRLGLANLDFGANMKSTTTGKKYDLMNPKYGQSNQGDVLERFIRGKESPVVGFAHSFLKNRTELSGQKMDFTNPNPFKNSIAQRFIPMLVQDMYEVGTQNPTHLPWMIPDAFGMSIQQYGSQNPNVR